MLATNLTNLLSPESANFLKKNHKLLIGGAWEDAVSGQTIAVVDPATGDTVSHIPSADVADVDRAVAAAKRASEEGEWSRMTGPERANLIWALAERLDELTDHFAELESLDTGRALYECKLVDVPGSSAMLRYMAGYATKINGETMEVSLPGPADYHAYTMREPLGVVAIILPWNYPLELAVWRMAPALAAGCTVILKPAEQTSLSTLRLGELFEEIGFPPGVVNVVTGYGETVGAALAEHPDVEGISFTGSTETGKNIVRAATSNLKRVFLELGGKSPMLVFDDADLDVTIPGVARAIFFSAGQVCTAGSRVFVHERIFDKVIEGVSEFGRSLKLGHGLHPETQLGPLVSQEQHDRVSRYLEEGRRDGAAVISGGGAPGSQGYFIEPTVLTDVKPHMSVYQEEIFGPVLCAMRFGDDDVDQVVRAANDTIYGLHASIWTQNLRTAHMVARGIKAGNVCINAHNFFDPALPMGGYKQSGWGRASGKEAIEHYTEVKAVAAKL
ncbi:aldehyde dehydrogenase family protein [Methyloligella sp. 2.7D]|uniref:aldehyde dehydrogenase family protein n=1 Tax=unclassified Methyloligella TaxID=2625955 RepID=UPI00157BBEF4|nr:aldehyde dehydrogenase family protein [Methyloligella sp. GL2]QKP77154.1 aldehyde dehydrogenase family protein [Methyloligella sp. GL2]